MSALQTAITNLQLKHGELVQAVKGYGGSVAGTANEKLMPAIASQRKVEDSVGRLRKRIENDGQSLILDWRYDVAVVNGEGKLLSEEVEFSRSTGGGRFNAQGQYEWVEAGVPRIDYDPVTGECKGLLIEEQRTNLALHSGDITGSSWIRARGTTQVSHEPDPFGSNTLTEFIPDTEANPHFIYTQPVLVANARYVVTAVVKPLGEVRGVMIFVGASVLTQFVDLVNGVTKGDLAENTTVKVRSLKDGFFEIVCTYITSASPGHVAFRVSSSSTSLVNHGFDSANDKLVFRSVQIERGSFPTSYIPTEGAAVTRAKDILTFVAREVGEDSYTFEVEYSLLGDLGTSSTWLGLTTPTGSGSDVGINASGRIRSSRYNFADASFNQPHGDDIHLAISVSPSELAGANAVGASFQVSGHYEGTGQPNTLNIGHAAFNGHLKSWSLYPFALTLAQLQELTQ